MVLLAAFAVLLGTAGAQSRPIENGASESEHGAPATPPGSGAARATAATPEGSVLDQARLTAALVRAVSTGDGRWPVAHCRGAGPRIDGGDRWARCTARMRAFARLFIEAGEVHRVDPWLLAAMASRESGMHPWAEGGVGEVGIMQLHPRGIGRDVAALLNRIGRARCESRTDACQRPVVERAAAHLRRVLERCAEAGHGSVPDPTAAALAAYNTGRCDSEAGLAYARRVLQRRERLHVWAREAAAGSGPASAASRGPEDES